MNTTGDRLERADRRIVQDIENRIVNKLRNPDGEFIKRYGPFNRLAEVEWRRPADGFGPVKRLEFSAMADFERARAHVYVGIVRGEPVDLEYLKMYPSENGEEDYRRRGFTFELIDGELWMKKPDGRKFRCSIDGYARHPDYRHASELQK